MVRSAAPAVDELAGLAVNELSKVLAPPECGAMTNWEITGDLLAAKFVPPGVDGVKAVAAGAEP